MLSVRVEILLNLAWVASAIALVTLWLRTAGRGNGNRRGQIIAIAVLVAILFPVISVSDDLMTVQGLAETDNSLRRNSLIPTDTHPVLPAVAMLPPPVFAGIAFSFLRHISSGWAAESFAQSPALASIQSRPPPKA
jgi:hypothetical protein